ncbi:hypothetical protein Btru_074169 [Bulinus truncatus]|nr:hypothetical protein Btru_074169 [Bulinus truncatus]
MVFTTDQGKNKPQNGHQEESVSLKKIPMDTTVHMGTEQPSSNGINGSTFSITPSSAGTGNSTEFGSYDDIITPSVPIKERVKDCCCSIFTLETLKRKLPIIVWLPQYTFFKFQYDLIAGITVGMTLIPQGLAYAGIAGLPPVYGLYSGFICCFIYLLMGSAKDITVGPSAITSLLTASFATSLSPKQPNGDVDPTMAIMLSFTTGLIHIFMGAFNLAISSPRHFNAFSSAGAITIAVQLSVEKTLLGLKGVPNDFVAGLDNIRQRLQYINVWDMTMGMTCIVVVILIKKLRGD